MYSNQADTARSGGHYYNIKIASLYHSVLIENASDPPCLKLYSKYNLHQFIHRFHGKVLFAKHFFNFVQHFFDDFVILTQIINSPS